MIRRGTSSVLIALLLSPAAVVVAAQNNPVPLSIQTKSLPQLTVGKRYRIRLIATGGKEPLAWRVTQGALPPGLQLIPQSGELVGTPRTPGEFEFVITATDGSEPPQTARQSYVVQVIAPLAIVWKQYPQVQGNTISGRVAVSNNTADTFDLTVIIVAVNQIGRATALGYQKLNLQSGAVNYEIPFTGAPGAGSYIVHADAIAEVPDKNAIYRARQQTPQPLTIAQP